jgi:pimeloyl-ACP methyl ester carboxylesterase
MVLVHGYGGGGAVFYKLAKDLAQYFHLYLVDLIGMGSSGRPSFPLREACVSVQVAENFFVHALRKWKQIMGIHQKIILAGHSFGGYVSAIYTM